MRSLTDIFYVKDFDNEHPEKEKLIPAKFLIGLDGQPVVNPNSTLNIVNALNNHYFNVDGTEIHDANPHNYLVVPASYSIRTATEYAHLINRADEISATKSMVEDFFPGGNEDLQKRYRNADGSMTLGRKPVPMFQDAASFHLGIVAQLTEYGPTLAEDGGTVVEILSQGKTKLIHYAEEFSNIFTPTTVEAALSWSNEKSNNERNKHSIEGGAEYIQKHIHEIANPLPPMGSPDDKQPTADKNEVRHHHDNAVQEPAHHAGVHSGKHTEGTVSEQANMPISPPGLELSSSGSIDAGGLQLNLQWANSLDIRFDALDQAITAILPPEARLGFQTNAPIPVPNDLDIAGTSVAGGAGNDVDDELLIPDKATDGDMLIAAELPKANLVGAGLTGVDLTGVDLTGVDLSGVDLTGADLSGADLINDNRGSDGQNDNSRSYANDTDDENDNNVNYSYVNDDD